MRSLGEVYGRPSRQDRISERPFVSLTHPFLGLGHTFYHTGSQELGWTVIDALRLVDGFGPCLLLWLYNFICVFCRLVISHFLYVWSPCPCPLLYVFYLVTFPLLILVFFFLIVFVSVSMLWSLEELEMVSYIMHNMSP